MTRPALLCYVTPEAVMRQLEKAAPGANQAANAQYNDFLEFATTNCLAISRYITTQTNRVFVPYLDTRTYYHDKLYKTADWRDNTLYLREDLLSASAVSWNGTAQTAYRLDTPDEPPYDRLVFDKTLSLALDLSTFNAATTVTGWWGCHPNPDDMYTVIETGRTLATTTATSLVVVKASHFDTLQIIKMDDELMLVTAINLPANTLTVTRGINGTTAAIHTAVSVLAFNVVVDLALAATKFMTNLYIKRGLQAAVQLPDGSISWGGLEKYVEDIITRYRVLPWASVPSR